MQFLPKVLPHVYGAGKAVSFLFRNDRSVKDPNKETLEHFTTENIQRSVTYLLILSWKSFLQVIFNEIGAKFYHVRLSMNLHKLFPVKKKTHTGTIYNSVLNSGVTK